MQKSLWIAALMGLLLASPVRARDTDGLYVFSGAGTWGCREALQKQTDPLWYSMLTGWVGGYLTASNYHLEDTFDLPLDPVEATGWILAYCRRNPLEYVAKAAKTLLWTLYPHRVQTAPAVSLPPIPAPRPVVPDLPQWEQPPRQQKTIPVKRPKRS